ncbi:MAG: hypothetical protein JRN52_08975 [Nitrososphaerota archaeon]|nr:hypothetical protein [Nitrososphaerota archaeon]
MADVCFRFSLSNVKVVRVSVEKKSKTGVFGSDFVSGGLKDFPVVYEDGYWIVVKSELSPSNVEDAIREAILVELGSKPSIYLETKESYLIVASWKGSTIEEQDLFKRIGQKIMSTNLILDESRLAAMKKRQKLGEFEHDALVVVREGNALRLWEKYGRTIEELEKLGSVRRKKTGGRLNRSEKFELTPEGYDAMEKSKRSRW